MCGYSGSPLDKVRESLSRVSAAWYVECCYTVGKHGLVGLGPSTVTTLTYLNCSATILAQERGIAWHSSSLTPTLPPKWRDAEGAGWGFVHGTGGTSGCTNTSSIAAVVEGHCKRVVPDWHCHRPTGQVGGRVP